MSLYGCVKGNPIVSTDPNGLLKIEPVEQKIGKGKCGEEAYIRWNFVLETKGGAPCNGWIVQQIRLVCRIDKCTGKCPKLADIKKIKKSDTTYWEAWHVTQGQPLEDDSGPDKNKYTDSAIWTPQKGTCGGVVVFGEVRFYCEDAKDVPAGQGDAFGTGDLKKKWKIQQVYGKEPCQVTPGNLRSIEKPPPDFWEKKPVEGSPKRDFISFWDCCCGNDKAGTEASPKKTE
jgi:hypothetical protein